MIRSKQSSPDISIVVPVFNEAGRINSFLGQFKEESSHISAEIIVVDAEDNKSTIRAISESDIVLLSAPKGRARQMNAGAAAAQGKILLFLHADTIVNSQDLQAILNALIKGDYVGGAFGIGYDSNNVLFKLIAMRSNLRCRMSRIPYGDQGIFIRKKYFEHIGGYREIDFLEDVDLMRRIKRDGKKICILRNRITVSARRWEREGILYGAIRNNIAVSLFHLGVNPNRLAKFFKPVN